jgi:hypothetical protein
VLGNFKKAPALRPFLNLGCLFDIPTGSYLKGAHGEHILNGGLAYLTGIGGRGNTYKSTLAHFMVLRAMDRYHRSEAIIYDTEISLTVQRLHQLARNLPTIGGVDLEDADRLMLTDKTTMIGNKWFNEYREVLKERQTNKEKLFLTTPFIDKNGENIKAFIPFLAEIDSLSQMDIESVETMFDKNEVGGSGLNMEAMRGAAAKSQMLTQLPGLTGTGGGYLLMTAHIGDEHQLDPYAPPQKKLAFLKGKVKFKRVPENFTFLMNNCWFCHNASVLLNGKNKTPEFPRNKEDDLQGDTDLMLVTLQNLRGKSGPTGLPWDIVVSQRDGVHVGLTEFYFLKEHGRYGLGGHDKSYYLELLPDVALQRTTVRGKIDSNPKLQRALEITSELCQIQTLWHDLPSDYLCKPKDLYEGLKAKGYNWDILLGQTRGYWMFKEDETPETPYFLSTLDLLRMNSEKDPYIPWWYEKAVNKETTK